MSQVIQESRIIIKRSVVPGVVPTIPDTNDHTDNTWLSTDLYPGELFINTADDKVWFRGATVQQIYPLYSTAGQQVFYYATFDDFPAVGTADIVYIAGDTHNIYYWNASLNAYESIIATSSVLWSDIIGVPNSTAGEIDLAVEAAHDVNDPNSSHYTKEESDGPAGNAGAKVDKEEGKGLSTNDFTDEYKDIIDAGVNEIVIENEDIEFPIPGSQDKAYFARFDRSVSLWSDALGAYEKITDGTVDRLVNLLDVEVGSPSLGQVLKYDPESGMWKNADDNGGAFYNVNATDTKYIPFGQQNLVYGDLDVYGKVINDGKITVINGDVAVHDDGEISGSGSVEILELATKAEVNNVILNGAIIETYTQDNVTPSVGSIQVDLNYSFPFAMTRHPIEFTIRVSDPFANASLTERVMINWDAVGQEFTYTEYGPTPFGDVSGILIEILDGIDPYDIAVKFTVASGSWDVLVERIIKNTY